MADNSNLATLTKLAQVIASRDGADPASSYTAKLLADAPQLPAKKLGEEAVETALAAVSGDKTAIRAEAADLLYHLLVVLQAAGVTLDDVCAELARREGLSGIDEKASRTS